MRVVLVAAVSFAAAASAALGGYASGSSVETLYSTRSGTIAAFAQDGPLIAWFQTSKRGCNTIHIRQLANGLNATLPSQTARNVTCTWLVGSTPVQLAIDLNADAIWMLRGQRLLRDAHLERRQRRLPDRRLAAAARAEYESRRRRRRVRRHPCDRRDRRDHTEDRAARRDRRPPDRHRLRGHGHRDRERHAAGHASRGRSRPARARHARGDAARDARRLVRPPERTSDRLDPGLRRDCTRARRERPLRHLPRRRVDPRRRPLDRAAAHAGDRGGDADRPLARGLAARLGREPEARRPDPRAGAAGLITRSRAAALRA